MVARFGDNLIASVQEWLSISSEVIPGLEVMMRSPGCVDAHRQGSDGRRRQRHDGARVLQDLAADECDKVVQGTYRQMAGETSRRHRREGKLEKLVSGRLSGYRFTVGKQATAKLPGASVCAVAKGGVTVMIVPFTAGAEELP